MPSLDRTKLARFSASLKASGAAGRRQDPISAIVWITVAMALMAGLAGFAKALTRGGMDPSQVLFFRNAGVLLMLLPMLAWRGTSLMKTKKLRLYWARAGLSFVSMLCWFHALSLIPLGEVTAITFLAPLFGTLCAIFFLGETVRLRRWTALIVGFIGAMIILRPTAGAVQTGQLLALGCAMMMGIIGPLVKHLTVEDDADRIVFITHLLITPLALVPALFNWQWPSGEQVPLIVGMAVCAALGHTALVRGFAATDASLVFTFEFSRLPFAVLVGWFAFGEPTDVWTWVGALVIFASAAYITRREARLKREANTVRPRDCVDPLCLTPVRMWLA